MQLEMKKVYEVRQSLTSLVDSLIENFSTEGVIRQLMVLRGYDKSPYSKEMFNMLTEVGIFRLDYTSELLLADEGMTLEKGQNLGILDSNGEFLLRTRYVVPIRDINNQVTALVGWYPDYKKYITTPTYGFAKDGQFFNIECFADAVTGNYDKYVTESGQTLSFDRGVVYLVEGIFDTLSLRALNLPALGNMGLDMSPLKSEILTRFGKVISIPDNDKSGRRVNKYASHLTKKGSAWEIQNENVIVQLPNGVKDVDDFIKGYICKEDLLRCQAGRFKLTLYED